MALLDLVYNANSGQSERVQRIEKMLGHKQSNEAYKHRENMASMKATYGLTEAEYQQIMLEQQGCCKICEKDFGQEAKRACVDHDHYTGIVRGLLCTQCNTRLGWLEKNIYRLLPYLQQR